MPTTKPTGTLSSALKVYRGFSKIGGSWFESMTEMATSASLADLRGGREKVEIETQGLGEQMDTLVYATEV